MIFDSALVRTYLLHISDSVGILLVRWYVNMEFDHDCWFKKVSGEAY